MIKPQIEQLTNAGLAASINFFYDQYMQHSCKAREMHTTLKLLEGELISRCWANEYTSRRFLPHRDIKT